MNFGRQNVEPIYSVVVKNRNRTLPTVNTRTAVASSVSDEDNSDNDDEVFPILEILVQAGMCRVRETIGNESKEISHCTVEQGADSQIAASNSGLNNNANKVDDDYDDVETLTNQNVEPTDGSKVSAGGNKVLAGGGGYEELFSPSRGNDSSSVISDASGRRCTEPERDPVKQSMDRAMKEILWKLALKQLKAEDWKKLARHWKFTEEHIKAIKHHYTDEHSYRNHGVRLLSIWFQCQSIYQPDTNYNPIVDLFDALVAIGQPRLAERVRSRCSQISAAANQQHRSCLVS
jgi:hypothetical protein